MILRFPVNEWDGVGFWGLQKRNVELEVMLSQKF